MMQIRFKADHSYMREVERYCVYGYYVAKNENDKSETRYDSSFWEVCPPKWKPAFIRPVSEKSFYIKDVLYRLSDDVRLKAVSNGHLEIEELA